MAACLRCGTPAPAGLTWENSPARCAGCGGPVNSWDDPGRGGAPATSATAAAPGQPGAGTWSPPSATWGNAPGQPGQPGSAPATTAIVEESFATPVTILLGVSASIVCGAVFWALSYYTEHIWYYAFVLYGVAIGTAFGYRAHDETWIVRGVLAVGCTFVSLFVSSYLVVRSIAEVELRHSGDLRARESLPVLVAPDVMASAVGELLNAAPLSYLLWPVALGLAWGTASGEGRKARKAAKAAAARQTGGF